MLLSIYKYLKIFLITRKFFTDNSLVANGLGIRAKVQFREIRWEPWEIWPFFFSILWWQSRELYLDKHVWESNHLRYAARNVLRVSLFKVRDSRGTNESVLYQYMNNRREDRNKSKENNSKPEEFKSQTRRTPNKCIDVSNEKSAELSR